MVEPARDRTAAVTAAGLGALVLAFVVPVGPASGEALDLARAALGQRRPFAGASTLADLLSWVIGQLPLGQAAVRPHAVAALAGVLVLALLAPRVLAAAQPPAAGIGALALLALSRPFLVVATLHPVVAVNLALFVWGAHLATRVHADAARAQSGLALALACGLASGVAWPVRVALWPAGVLLALRALRLGHRWPLVAPSAFISGCVPLLGAVVAAAPAATLAQVVAHLFLPAAGAPGLEPGSSGASFSLSFLASSSATGLAVGDDLGVLAMLVAGLGTWTLLRRPGRVLSVAVVMWLVIVLAAAVTGAKGLAVVAAAAALTVPVATGAATLGAAFGRAGNAVALVVAVAVVVPAAWVGLGRAMAVPGRQKPAELTRRLDAAARVEAPERAGVPGP